MMPLTPQPDARKARTPHRRQSFHQLPQPSKNSLRELNRQRSKRTSGPCSEVRIGKLQEDGTIVWISTEDEYAKARMEDLRNKHFDAAQRKADQQRKFNEQMAQIDSWASHA